jgi:cell division protein FtsX
MIMGFASFICGTCISALCFALSIDCLYDILEGRVTIKRGHIPPGDPEVIVVFVICMMITLLCARLALQWLDDFRRLEDKHGRHS